MPMVCKACGRTTRRVILQETGDHRGELWCPGCHENAKGLRESGTAMFRDEIPGGQVFENYGKHPIKFYSHSERRAYMKSHGLHERETFAPMPGTDKDPQGIPNPKGYMDPQTLENARILLSRPGALKDPQEDSVDGLLAGTFSGDITERDAKAIAAGDPVRQSRLHRRIASGQGSSD